MRALTYLSPLNVGQNQHNFYTTKHFYTSIPQIQLQTSVHYHTPLSNKVGTAMELYCGEGRLQQNTEFLLKQRESEIHDTHPYNRI
jgi:hypothetical protein